jgi:hypothetical protein
VKFDDLTCEIFKTNDPRWTLLLGTSKWNLDTRSWEESALLPGASGVDYGISKNSWPKAPKDASTTVLKLMTITRELETVSLRKKQFTRGISGTAFTNGFVGIKVKQRQWQQPSIGGFVAHQNGK